jgi:hypothetical protein
MIRFFLLPAILLSASPAFAQPWRITVDGRASCGLNDAPGTELQLAPGDYDVIPVAGGINVWGVVIGCDAGGGNCDTGYLFFYWIKLGNSTPFALPPTCCPRSDRWATPQLAVSHAPVSTFTVPGPGITTAKFLFLDNPCADNIGAVTFDVVPHTPPCPADFNGDGFLDFFDYDEYVSCFETGACPPGKTADFNGDAFVDFFDYDDFVSAFELGC